MDTHVLTTYASSRDTTGRSTRACTVLRTRTSYQKQQVQIGIGALHLPGRMLEREAASHPIPD